MSVISELKKTKVISTADKFFSIEDGNPYVLLLDIDGNQTKIPVSRLSDQVFLVKFGSMWDANSYINDIIMWCLNDFGFEAFSIDTDLVSFNNNSELLTLYNITQNPTYIVFKGETELTRLTGNQTYNKLKETMEYYVNQNN